MTEKHKHPVEGRPRPVAQIREALDSPDHSSHQQAIDACWDLAPHVEPVLAALLRGLNDPDDLVRLHAFKGLMRAFPRVEDPISLLLGDILDSKDPKVRLAAVGRVIILLANALADLAGVKPDASTSIARQSDPFKEDLMEHAGRWIAWTRDRQRILAVADSFTDAMKQAEAAGESDPYVKKAPGVSPKAARKPFAILDDESPDILDDVRKVIPHHKTWLDAPNDSLGGEKPRDLIGTEREREVRYLLRGIEDGITT